jgi:hypothetical protein
MSDRCTDAAVRRGDQLAGTATLVRSFLLVEHAGPWGEVALRDARIPDETRAWLRAQVGANRVRVLLVRRPGARSVRRPRVFAVRTGEWCETAVLDDIDDVRSLDLASLAAGLLDDVAHGLLDLELMRGRATLSMPAQYAEIHLRRELGERRDDAVRHLGSRRDEDEVVSTFEVAGTTYDVRVLAPPGAPAAHPWGATRANPVLRHEVTGTTRR